MAKRSIAIPPIVTTGVRTSADLRSDASGFVVYEPLDTLLWTWKLLKCLEKRPGMRGNFALRLVPRRGERAPPLPLLRSERSPAPQRSRSLPPAKVGVFARLVADLRDRFDRLCGTKAAPALFSIFHDRACFHPEIAAPGLSAFLLS